MYDDNLNNANNIDKNDANAQSSNNGYENQQSGSEDNNYYINNNPYGTPNGGANFNGNPNQAPKEPKKNNNWKKVVGGIVIAAGIALVGGVGFYSVGQIADQLKNDTSKNIASASEEPSAPSDPEAAGDTTLETTKTQTTVTDSVSNVVENVMPSIVSITTKSTETISDYFGRTYDENVEGSGSGIIIGQNSNEVLVVTNNHVISGNDTTVELTFCDGTTLTGAVKGADSSADLAVVAVKFADISDDTKSQIKVISIGDSDATKVGEAAIAIGNALGYGQSVTVGHVSALNREIAVEDSSMTLMQTDAAINPGNSGGALLNAQGQLIGINSAKTATTEVEGMGYAIPISDALPIIQDLMDGKTTSDSNTAYLGIVGQNITQSNSRRFNIPEGVYVTEVAEGSPAEQAGIKTGMVIVGFDGKEIATSDDLMKIISSLGVGDKVTVNVAVNQNGKYVTKEITVTMGSKADLDSERSEDSQQTDPYSETDPYSGTDPYGNSGEESDPFSWFGN